MKTLILLQVSGNLTTTLFQYAVSWFQEYCDVFFGSRLLTSPLLARLFPCSHLIGQDDG